MATKIPLSLGNQAWDMQATAQQIDQCCGLGRGVNLLDNWWFGPGVINQLEVTTLTASGTYQYFVDRWKINTGSIELSDTGLIITPTSDASSTIKQVRDKWVAISGKTLTLSVMVDGEVVSFSAEIPAGDTTFSHGSGFIGNISLILYRSSAGFEVRIGFLKGTGPHALRAAKLEIGTEQTLAHREGDTWVLNDPPPNQVLELLKCQKYQYVPTHSISSYGVLGYGLAATGNQFQFNIPVPTPMRGYPTITMSGSFEIRGDGKRVAFNSSDVIVGSSQFSQGYATIDITLSSPDFNPWLIYQLTASGNSKLIFDSNL